MAAEHVPPSAGERDPGVGFERRVLAMAPGGFNPDEACRSAAWFDSETARRLAACLRCPMRTRPWLPVSLLGAAWLLAPRGSQAAPAPSSAATQAAPSALVEITDASSLLYNFDNRDTRPGQVASVANDRWGLFYNRLNLQVTRGRLTLSLRADNADLRPTAGS